MRTLSAGFALASKGTGGSLPRVSSLERCAAAAAAEVSVVGLAGLFSTRIASEMRVEVEEEICRAADQIATTGEGAEPAALMWEVLTGLGGPSLLDLTSDKVAGAVGYANAVLMSRWDAAVFLQEAMGEDGTIAVSASDLPMGDGAILFRRTDDLFDASVALAGARGLVGSSPSTPPSNGSKVVCCNFPRTFFAPSVDALPSVPVSSTEMARSVFLRNSAARLSSCDEFGFSSLTLAACFPVIAASTMAHSP
eukprot:CAMPEP_0194349472 /NCGR_PEP_ID=MMETSP0171-20130528/107109_1 /TAXON_ID=218684 /ORGANISM="Corethron pennatum, Strain L29A3" /LENGTH=251 /DNA_ID=CAMNT_0039116929 /DNA_START=816 /DNA_END=1571 /DNA_ORIENTATION=-